jgi:hypothetical protein
VVLVLLIPVDAVVEVEREVLVHAVLQLVTHVPPEVMVVLASQSLSALELLYLLEVEVVEVVHPLELVVLEAAEQVVRQGPLDKEL